MLTKNLILFKICAQLKKNMVFPKKLCAVSVLRAAEETVFMLQSLFELYCDTLTVKIK